MQTACLTSYDIGTRDSNTEPETLFPLEDKFGEFLKFPFSHVNTLRKTISYSRLLGLANTVDEYIVKSMHNLSK